MMPPRTLALFAALALAMPAKGQEITWNAEFYDPAAETGAPADLVLPMPCGGAMAFQRVDVPVDGPTPLDDRRVRLGSPQSDAGFTDYLIGTHLRGGFTDPDPTTTFFYLSRYELTADQAAALQGDCRDPSPRGRVPALGLSWFDGVALGRVYSEWLRTNAPDALPREGGAAGFVRLPTEVEWEYAARGGAALDPAAFAARTYPMPEGIDGHAWHQAVSRGGARPVGLRGANPLGLHDLYGNAEELMLEPFRANAAGRAHGQAGGLVTRGGSYLSSPEQLYSARRAEWPMFRASDGRASAAETFGARFVLSAHVAVDDARTRALDESWQNATAAAPGVEDDPLGALDEVISDETDQRRAAALAAVRQMLVQERGRSEEATLETLRANLTNGAVLVSIIRQTSRNITRFETVRDEARAGLEVFTEGDRRAELEGYLTFAERELSNLTPTRDDALTSYGQSLESFVSGVDPILMRNAQDRLRIELQMSGQQRLEELVEQFLFDIETYRANPELSRADLVQLAVDP